MPTLHIPIGIPGCGKSHMAQTLGVKIVSSDAIRAEMGDVNDQSRNDEVFKRFHDEIYRLLTTGHDVFADATNLTLASRRNLLRTVAEAQRVQPVYTHAVVFRNLNQAIARNQVRDRVVPEDAMLRMIQRYEAAMLLLPHENYDYVTEVSATR